ALIVNELVNNALKYSEGDIEVYYRVTGEQAMLEVFDHGEGFPPDFEPLRASNVGLELVHNLTRWDLHGLEQYDNREGGGGRVTVTMPLVETAGQAQTTQI